MLMDTEFLFSFFNGWAALCWIYLIVFYHKPETMPRLAGVGVLFLALAYAILLVPGLGQMDLAAFSTLAGVMSLFTQPEAVLVGWIHYLAFDLFTGIVLAHSAQRYGISRWVMLPIFFFTFMLGPVGFLIYSILLMVKTKSALPKFFPN
jgi:Domain of unknown function (DUF4281)